jgi:hypothetical protein
MVEVKDLTAGSKRLRASAKMRRLRILINRAQRTRMSSFREERRN